ncbi:MAG: DNA replication and repair protein RecF, partial [Coriobacteriaceae bacterium]|nr:DNA replication and repair protein RecF [Coriobacteriaceae bacterium]
NISEEKKEYQVNGKKKRPKDIRGILPSVIFSPDDLHLAKGPHSIRRAAVDAIGTQLNANYHTIKKDYERLIRHKNYLLKEEQPPAVLQSVNDILAVIGTQLQCYRYALFQKLAPLIQEHYQGIAGSSETLACSYTPFWKEGSTSSSSGTADSSANDLADTLPDLDRTEVQARFAASFKKKEAEERQRRQACTGPHTDRVGFSINGSDAGIYGSQGQQRSLVLAFKLAELAAIQDIAHQKPVLLLDDVMSELDSTRRSALLRYVSDDIQTFITTTTLDYFPKEAMQDASVVTLPSKQAQGGGKAP